MAFGIVLLSTLTVIACAAKAVYAVSTQHLEALPDD